MVLGMYMLGTALIIIYILLLLTFLVGFFKHIICFEWEDLPINILGNAVLIGMLIWLIFD